MLSLLSGAVLVGLVYGLSFLPTATLNRPDDIELIDDESAARDADGSPAQVKDQQDTDAA